MKINSSVAGAGDWRVWYPGQRSSRQWACCPSLRACGCLDSRCRNVNQCLCSWRNGWRAADDASTFSSCPPQCVDFPDGDFHAWQRTFRHRAGLYDPDAFTHFDQPESRGIFWFGSVVAASVVPKHKQASAVATMFMGLTTANIGGVPAATGWAKPSAGGCHFWQQRGWA